MARSLALLFCAVLGIKLRRVRAAQRMVLGDRRAGSGGPRRRRSSSSSRRCTTTSRMPPSGSTSRMEPAEHRIDGAVAYRALIRYDAYGEMSGASRPRSHCSTPTAPGSCCPRSITATRRACTPRRSARASPSWSSRPRRTRRSGSALEADVRSVGLAGAGHEPARRRPADARRLLRPRGHVHAGGADRRHCRSGWP